MKLKIVARALLVAGVFSITAIEFTGCGAAHTAIKKRNLDVQTKMSETIFLEPTTPDKKIIYVDVRNTSDKEMNVKDTIIASLQSHGYTLTTNPQNAYFMLQANVLQAGKTDLRKAQEAFNGGFGGAVVGSTVGYAMNTGNRDVAAAGLIGAALGMVGDALVDDTYYTMITDVQIRERSPNGEWKNHRTRVVSTANKVNLDFDEAQPALQEALGKSLSGLF